jgi:CheY-like chemotaxis protein
VLANLPNNAAKYTPQGGKIALRVEREASQVVLCVIDNGIGMTSAVQHGAFDLFTQAERTPGRAQGGLGIGLALVKSLVELHRGSVALHSDGPGQGSRMTVRLPRLADDVPAAGAPPAARTAGVSRSVRVVDDNVDAAQLLAMVLEQAGHRVAVAHHAHRALTHARADPPDACILDIGLPDMDGNVLARELRALPRMRGALLIAVTYYGRAEDRAASLEAGFDHYLVKPVDVSMLAKLLD